MFRFALLCRAPLSAICLLLALPCLALPRLAASDARALAAAVFLLAWRALRNALTQTRAAIRLAVCMRAERADSNAANSPRDNNWHAKRRAGLASQNPRKVAERKERYVRAL